MQKVTVDVKKAVKILKSAGARIRKSGFRAQARNAAKIIHSDLSTTAPQFKGDAKKIKSTGYHIFSAPKRRYRLRIRRGNLRKSMKVFTFNRSKLLWVGAKYKNKSGYSLSGSTIGTSVANSFGFYDKWLVRGTSPRKGNRGIRRNDYMGRTARRTESRVIAQLKKDGNDYLRMIASRYNTTV